MKNYLENSFPNPVSFRELINLIQLKDDDLEVLTLIKKYVTKEFDECQKSGSDL